MMQLSETCHGYLINISPNHNIKVYRLALVPGLFT